MRKIGIYKGDKLQMFSWIDHGRLCLTSIKRSVGRLASQSVSWSVRRTIGQSLYWTVNPSSMEITLTGVNYLNYPFSRSSSWSFRSRGDWLGLIINQEYSFTPLTIARLQFCFPSLLMHVISVQFKHSLLGTPFSMQLFGSQVTNIPPTKELGRGILVQRKLPSLRSHVHLCPHPATLPLLSIWAPGENIFAL